jgi:hypothetical protein
MNATRPRTLVTHWVHAEVASYLTGFCNPLIPSRQEKVWPPEKIAGLAADADGVIACMADSIDEAFLSGCLRLRVVAATLKGYDNFDAEVCSRHGVRLTIVPDDHRPDGYWFRDHDRGDALLEASREDRRALMHFETETGVLRPW